MCLWKLVFGAKSFGGFLEASTEDAAAGKNAAQLVTISRAEAAPASQRIKGSATTTILFNPIFCVLSIEGIQNQISARIFLFCFSGLNTQIASNMSFSSKIAVVAGSTRGIGKAIALDLARAGASLALLYNSDAEKAKAVRWLRGSRFSHR